MYKITNMLNVVNDLITACEIAFDKYICILLITYLAQVMAWYHKVISHYANQISPSSVIYKVIFTNLTHFIQLWTGNW